MILPAASSIPSRFRLVHCFCRSASVPRTGRPYLPTPSRPCSSPPLTSWHCCTLSSPPTRPCARAATTAPRHSTSSPPALLHNRFRTPRPPIRLPHDWQRRSPPARPTLALWTSGRKSSVPTRPAAPGVPYRNRHHVSAVAIAFTDDPGTHPTPTRGCTRHGVEEPGLRAPARIQPSVSHCARDLTAALPSPVRRTRLWLRSVPRAAEPSARVLHTH